MIRSDQKPWDELRSLLSTGLGTYQTMTKTPIICNIHTMHMSPPGNAVNICIHHFAFVTVE